MAKILIIEDDRLLLDIMCEWLGDEHYQIESTDNGRVGLEMLLAYQFDLVLLDWELPELSGIEILKSFRDSGKMTPVIMLTRRSTVDEKASGLDLGCDDYLPKPFEMKELTARIRAVLRRPQHMQEQVLKAQDLELDLTKRNLKKNGKEVNLLPKEFALLELFMRHPNQVFNTATLIDRLWKSNSEVTDEAVSATVWRLRKKIDEKGQESMIRTVYGVGFRFDA